MSGQYKLAWLCEALLVSRSGYYIETFYNRTRLHSSLAYRSPITFESQLDQKN